MHFFNGGWYRPPTLLKFFVLKRRFQKCKKHYCRSRGSCSNFNLKIEKSKHFLTFYVFFTIFEFLNWMLNLNPWTYSNVSYIFEICASRRWIWVLFGVCTTPRFKARMTLKNCYFSQLLTIFKVRRAFEPEVIQTSKSTHFLRLEVLIPNM